MKLEFMNISNAQVVILSPSTRLVPYGPALVPLVNACIDAFVHAGARKFVVQEKPNQDNEIIETLSKNPLDPGKVNIIYLRASAREIFSQYEQALSKEMIILDGCFLIIAGGMKMPKNSILSANGSILPVAAVQKELAVDANNDIHASLFSALRGKDKVSVSEVNPKRVFDFGDKNAAKSELRLWRWAARVR